MRQKLFKPCLGIVCIAAVIMASGSGEPRTSLQSKPSVRNDGASESPKNSLSKTVLDLTEQINDLKERLRMLETEQRELRERLVQAERSQVVPAGLNEAGVELARFDCEVEFNKAHAIALAQGTPGYTLEGAAALNCTQRLAKITEKAVHSLENR